MKTESIANLEREARRVIDDLQSTKSAMIVGDDGAPAAFLIEPATYKAEKARLELLEAIALGERDFAEGRTLTHAQVKEKMGKWLK